MFTERHADIVEAYLQGEKASSIARQYNISRSRVYQILSTYECWDDVIQEKEDAKKERNKKAEELYASGYTVSQIADRLDIPERTVYWILMGTRKSETETKRKKLVEMYLSGKTYEEISIETGYSMRSINTTARRLFGLDWEDAKRARREVRGFIRMARR